MAPDGYHEDFESSVELSLREDNHHGSKPLSPTSTAPPDSRGSLEGSHPGSPHRGSPEEIHEDMAEELTQHSGTSNGSQQSERMLDLNSQTGDSQVDTLDNVVSPKRSQNTSPSLSPPSPGRDEMPGYRIGDRVLVSNVQPGTLRFKGQTLFANGFWAGVELDKSEGSNNGTYDDVVYFQCEDGHGIFAPPDKISRLPERFEICADATEDEDSFFDDLSDKDATRRSTDGKSQQGGVMGQTSQRARGTVRPADASDGPVDHQNNLTFPEDSAQSLFKSADIKEGGRRPIPNGRSRDIILEFEDAPSALYISDMDKIDWGKRSLKQTTSLIDSQDLDVGQKTCVSEAEVRETDTLGTFADKLINNFVKDAVKQFSQIRKAKEEKIATANQMAKGWLGEENGGVKVSEIQRDGLPFFLDAEQEEISSPELCNRPESPVLGTSGQEELAKRLAELELSRELLDELGDEQADRKSVV